MKQERETRRSLIESVEEDLRHYDAEEEMERSVI